MAISIIDRLVSSLVPPPVQPLTISFRDAAELTQVSEKTLRKLASNGVLHTSRFGTRRLILVESLENFVRQGQG